MDDDDALDPISDAIREIERLLTTDAEPKKRRGARIVSNRPAIEQPEAGGHLGEQQTGEYDLPPQIRRMLGTTTPPHLLTVRRKR